MDDDGEPEFAKAVDEQLAIVTEWWATGATPAEGFVQTLLRSPEERHDVERFLHTSGIRETEEDEALVVYVTSHGAIGASNRHFLLLPRTDPDRLLATGMPTNEVVIAALDSPARHVLVIVNACEAGGIGPELAALVADLARERTAGGTLNVLATTAARTPVMGREFALILRTAHDWLKDAAGITRPHLSLSEFLQALERATDRLNEERALSLPGPRPVLPSRLGVRTPTLPNPGYRPRRAAVPPERAEVAATHDELEYWLDRASGRADADDPGWYFSGRRELNRRLTRFVGGPAGVLIVTGAAASGKSAVLARAVTLSDPAFRASPRYADAVRRAPVDGVPPEGSVQVAVSARNRGPLSLIEAIGVRLGCEPDPSRPAADALRQWQQRLRDVFTKSRTADDAVTVVVDGLDESPAPLACVRDVLAPLAAYAGGPCGTGAAPVPAQAPGQADGPAPLPPPLPARRGLRLLLGVRSSVPGAPDAAAASPGGLLGELLAAFPAAQVVRTDGDGVRDDVAAYVTALLCGEPWSADPALAERAARMVAARVGRSFLDARLAAEQLRRGDASALLGDARWLDRLDRGTAGLFEEDLRRVADEGLNAVEATALLRATAFGLGRGIPWAQVWPAAAEALLGAPIEHADEKIRQLLEGRLAGYLTHDSEDDRVVYRPAHERLAAMLRRWPRYGLGHEARHKAGGTDI
ncbi:hypothetical protein QCN29_25780 [Streptomyces sp. HNM0663]|uniref:CHAT domain-containing protein n=1 Tax=Streptomyces chengmaiensis TaxID=3040919 RepID=A0ABT6HUX8_9ACTN|nr:hypothetical protein [Streptomyces chengmaiensis]MDH2392132.1 hypothetical protein [Streptomyces chengmaiensis]